MGHREELIQIFVTESRENIDLLDQEIVRLEQDPENHSLLDEIFRAFHTLKGNAGIVGMTRFEKIAHITEEVLTQIRDGKRAINREVISFLLDSLDQIKILHESIEETGTDSAPVKKIPTPDKADPKPKTAQKKNPSKAKTPVKRKTAGKKKTSKQSTETASDDIIAEDGSWGLFTDNLRAGKSQQEIVAEDGSWGLFPENIASAEEVSAGERNETTGGSAPQTPPKTETIQNWNKGDSTIRVNVSLLDSLMNTVGELVLSRNQILQFASQFEHANLHAASQRLNLCTSELQEGIMKTRMQPIANVFNRFPRVVRDVTRDHNKKVDLRLEGAETELDKTIIEGIRDPLTHLVRNAIDHGIEDEETRRNSGKDSKGVLILRAYHEGGQVNIEIIDDGAGINPEKLRTKALEKGIITTQQAEELSDRDAINLIFKPGFSTAPKITNISGRGVGMDVVKTNIDQIGGIVDISSTVGKGTTIKIKIPLTLAIIPALVVTTGKQRFAIPQINLQELVRLEGEAMQSIETMGNAEIYRLRGKLLPVLRLKNILGLDSKQEENTDSLSIVVLTAGDISFGLIVDKIHDTEEIVVKPLSKHLKIIKAFAGATVMGDGKVALILDVVGLADTAKILLNENVRRLESVENADVKAVKTKTFLLFSINEKEQFAIPLALISRLEKINRSEIQMAGNKEVIQYRGRILPLLRIENYIQATPSELMDKISLIVFSVEKNEVGFVVNEISDIIETSAELDTGSFQQEGILGSMIVHNKITLVIDAYAIISREYPEWFQRKSQVLAQEQKKDISNVLIVDDSPFIRSIERSYLESEGYEVYEANNGDEALERMTANNIDLVITDIEMPKMDGLELTRNIRANKNYRDMPIVAVSSLGSENDIEKGLEAGVNSYLIKLDRDELLTSLEKIIHSSE